MRAISIRRFRSVAFGLMLFVGLVVGVPSAQAASHPDRRNFRHEIEKMEDRWRDAMLKHDTASLQTLLSDDFSGITADGAIQTRDQLLERIGSSSLNLSKLLLSERKVRIYGSTAVVTSVAEVEGNRGQNEVIGRYRYTRVYVRNAQGQWKIVSFEASRILEPGDRRQSTPARAPAPPSRP